MISVVIVGRNDNYGGDFEARLMETTEYNLNAFRTAGLDVELVFVEWNPIPGQPLLSNKVAEKFSEARCVVVGDGIHRLINQNRHIKVYEYHAKNVGAKRARGDWLLLTNPDNFFGADILSFLKTGAFDPDTIYRAGWINIANSSKVDDQSLVDAYAFDKKPFCSASGDFIFCAKSLFDKIGGFREDLAFTNTHKDSIFCKSVYDLTNKAQKIGNTYHLTHGRDSASNRRIQFDWSKVPRVPQSEYGLDGAHVITEEIGQVVKLTLTSEMLKVANSKLPIEPIVPWEYRPKLSLRKKLKIRLRDFLSFS